MTEEQIKERIFNLLLDRSYDVNIEIKEDMNITNDLMFDSLDEQELIFAIEREFDITITPRETYKLKCVKDYVKLVKKKLHIK